jgi:hypothetical protein
MARKKQKKLIIGLIRDGLINMKLVNGLNSLGLNANDYNISIGDTIFVLMGFKNDRLNDLIFENVYLAIAEKVKHIDFSVPTEDLERLSEEIYAELLFAKEICYIKQEKDKKKNTEQNKLQEDEKNCYENIGRPAN